MAEEEASLSRIPKEEETKEVKVENETITGAEREAEKNNEKNIKDELLHPIKNVPIFLNDTYVCLQNENGPCPLLCLVNILFLRATFEFPKHYITPGVVPANRLVELVANHLLESYSERATKDPLLQKTLEDVIEVLPSLQTGLDVNIKFNATDGFEFSSVISVFDLLGIRLLHGWLIDPQDENTYKLISELSYNEAVSLVVSSENQETVEQIRSFLTNTASQLTHYGLVELHSSVKENEFFALFRNNHFHVGYKLEGKLYLLVTDVGYKDTLYCWEELAAIDGDCELVAFNFSKDLATAKTLLSEKKRKNQLEQMSGIDPKYLEAQKKELARFKAESNRKKDSNRKVSSKKKSKRGGCVVC